MALTLLTGGVAGCAGGASEAAPPPDPPATDLPATTTTAPTTTTTTTTTTTEPTTTTTTSTSPVPTTAPRPVPAPGPLRSGRATHYDLQGSGNCMFPDYPGANTMFVALNAADYGTADLCGAWLFVQGNRGSATVQVTDQCPECPPGALDLSREAFAAVTGDRGVSTVQWRVVSGPSQPAISYRIKEGSSQWWLAILVMHHRNPVTRLEVQSGGRWVALERHDWNHFVAESGLGPGPYTIRLTDHHGEQVVSSGVMPTPGKVFPTPQQFTGH